MQNYKSLIKIRAKTFVLEYSQNLNLEDLIDFLIDNFNVDTERGGWNYLAVTKDLSNGNTHTFVYCSFNYSPYIYSTKTVYRADGIEAKPRVCTWNNPYLLRIMLTFAGQINMKDIYTNFDNEFIEENSFVLKNKYNTKLTGVDKYNQELLNAYYNRRIMKAYTRTFNTIRGRTFVLEYSEDLNLQNLIDFLTISFKVDTKQGGWNYIALTKDLANGDTHTFVFCFFNYSPHIYSTKTVYRADSIEGADGIEAKPCVCVWNNPYLLRVVLTFAGQINMEDIYTNFDNEFIEENSFVLKNNPIPASSIVDKYNEELQNIFDHTIGKKKK